MASPCSSSRHGSRSRHGTGWANRRRCWVALVGLVVNVLAFWVLQGGDRENLNMRAAALHVAGDLLGSVAAILAALVIMATGWTPIDPILSVLVAVIILRSAWHVVRES